MSVMGYVFQRGDAVMLPAAYNGKVGLAILCPTTKQVKGHPLEVEIPSGQAGEG
jgi:mRNA interferase MazF